MTEKQAKYQLFPPHILHINGDECSIRTLKKISGLASTDPKFPASEWGCLVPKVVLIINILLNSIFNHEVSYHAYLHFNFEFNDTPLAATETRVLIHSKCTTKTW